MKNEALASAAQLGRSDLVTLLLGYGADPQVKSRFTIGESAWLVACNLDIVRLFWDQGGIDINSHDYGALLQRATNEGNREIVEFLLSQDGLQESVIQEAWFLPSNSDVTKALWAKRNASANDRYAQGSSLLHKAV